MEGRISLQGIGLSPNESDLRGIKRLTTRLDVRHERGNRRMLTITEFLRELLYPFTRFQ